jgi:hypothetical protein
MAQSILAITGRDGDTQLTWETGVDDLTTAEVRARFSKLVAEGNLAYRAPYEGEDTGGSVGVAIRSFDSGASLITIIRGRLVGG